MNFDAIIDWAAHGLAHFTLWQTVVYTLITTHITIAAVTIFLHRCQAHRALELHPLVSHFFRLWLWLGTGMVTKEWAAIHRKHHAKCEIEGDPHSPVVFGIKKVLLEGVELYKAEAKNVETMEKYGTGTPDDWIERNIYTKYSWQGVAIMLMFNWLLFGLGVGTVVWVVQMLWIPLLAAGVVNGIGHFWGYRNYNAPDQSRNIVPWGILIGGEELHNNHHTYGTSAKLSSKWYEFDIGWMYIRILETLGLATVKKVAPTPKFVAAKSVADLDTLQAVITHRYHVMASYTQSLKAAYTSEVAATPALQTVRGLLHKDDEALAQPEKQDLQAALAHSKVLATLVEMRTELLALWGKSNATREQLLLQLQAWCAKAEASGVNVLKEFSLRLRSYA